MPKTRIIHITVNKIDTLNRLQDELNDLDNQLAGSNLSCLATFNKAYQVVTSAISESVKDGYFENPIFITSFTLCFSHYYFTAINDAFDNKDLPIAWSLLLKRKDSKSLPNFIYLLMGANAHINHDLSLVMLKILANNYTENLLQDIVKVDKLLVKSGNEILAIFTESKPLPRFIKNRLRYIYLPIVMHVILYWRIRAWKDYLYIKNYGLPPNRSQIKGKTIAHRLLNLSRLLSR